MRVLLLWFGAYRRSWCNVKSSRCIGPFLGIITLPDFEGESSIRQLTSSERSRQGAQPTGTNAQGEEVSTTSTTTTTAPPCAATAEVASIVSVEPVDPTHRVSRLMAANTPPVYVAPDTLVSRAITTMLAGIFPSYP